ncbi:MAG: hypothetical protein RL220_311 [Bacteroidota bacterium]|jgi:hypothetical protein
MFWNKVVYYLNPRNLFRKEEGGLNLRFMHGINKISIYMFLICIGVLIARAIMR